MTARYAKMQLSVTGYSPRRNVLGIASELKRFGLGEYPAQLRVFRGRCAT